jgi:pimeloyl-ACP methyl ester carboxylesterase
MMAELYQVHAPTNTTGTPRIVFVHGLDGHYRETWMTRPKDENTLWPKWLGEDTGCPVWLLSYGAAMSRWKADSMALPRQATAVIERLSAEPALMEGPLVLVGHSLGGLVIKTALHQGLGCDVPRHERIAKNVRGIAFVGTPHFGSKLASIAAYARFMRANPQVSDLRMDNAHLEELNQFFLKQCRELEIACRVFTETQPVRLPWWLAGRFLPGVTIVSPSSSQAHIPGEVGIPIDANHIDICKPESRRTGLYPTMLSFIGEVEAEVRPRPDALAAKPPLPSDRFDAVSVEERVPDVVHLAFSTHEVALHGTSSSSSICASVCIITDAPDRLRKTLDDIRLAVISDPLVPESTKQLAASIPLAQLLQVPAARAIALRSLAVISFSAYVYYCSTNTFNELPFSDRIERLVVTPLVHRLSKKSERVGQFSSSMANMSEYLARATARVEELYHWRPMPPRSAPPKYTVLEELATIVATISCRHLADLSDGVATESFESLRTRIRYAENVATGERHKRDRNPLP